MDIDNVLKDHGLSNGYRKGQVIPLSKLKVNTPSDIGTLISEITFDVNLSRENSGVYLDTSNNAYLYWHNANSIRRYNMQGGLLLTIQTKNTTESIVDFEVVGDYIYTIEQRTDYNSCYVRKYSRLTGSFMAEYSYDCNAGYSEIRKFCLAYGSNNKLYYIYCTDKTTAVTIKQVNLSDCSLVSTGAVTIAGGSMIRKKQYWNFIIIMGTSLTCIIDLETKSIKYSFAVTASGSVFAYNTSFASDPCYIAVVPDDSINEHRILTRNASGSSETIIHGIFRCFHVIDLNNNRFVAFLYNTSFYKTLNIDLSEKCNYAFGEDYAVVSPHPDGYNYTYYYYNDKYNYFINTSNTKVLQVRDKKIGPKSI